MKTIDNFRDFGGYATTDDRRLRSGRVYRSGTLDSARGEDFYALQAIGLKTIVDLRGPQEKKTPLTIAGSRRIDLPIELENRAREKLQPLMTKRGAEHEVVDILKQMYRDLADEAWPQVGQFLHVLLAAESYPVLVHCRAGKDRTGFVCAIVQQAVGVERALVFQDYLKTNEFFVPVSRRMIRTMKIFSLGRIQTQNIQAAFSAREEYLQAALDRIDEVHGGMAAFLERCGITSRELETLRELLVE